MTVKETLRDARTLVRKKIRQANSADQKAYKKAYNIKGVKSGNTRRRSKRPEGSTSAINGGLAETGRDAGIIGEGSEKTS